MIAIVKTLQPRVIIYTARVMDVRLAETAHNLAIPARVIIINTRFCFRDKSLYHDQGRGTVPDHIFATGDVTRESLARNMKFCQGQITTLGSQMSNIVIRNAFKLTWNMLLLQKVLRKRCILWPR